MNHCSSLSTLEEPNFSIVCVIILYFLNAPNYNTCLIYVNKHLKKHVNNSIDNFNYPNIISTAFELEAKSLII